MGVLEEGTPSVKEQESPLHPCLQVLKTWFEKGVLIPVQTTSNLPKDSALLAVQMAIEALKFKQGYEVTLHVFGPPETKDVNGREYDSARNSLVSPTFSEKNKSPRKWRDDLRDYTEFFRLGGRVAFGPFDSEKVKRLSASGNPVILAVDPSILEGIFRNDAALGSKPARHGKAAYRFVILYDYQKSPTATATLMDPSAPPDNSSKVVSLDKIAQSILSILPHVDAHLITVLSVPIKGQAD